MVKAKLIELLRKPLFHSADVDKVKKSRWMWADYNGSGAYHLSLLGIINGILPYPIQLVIFEEDET